MSALGDPTDTPRRLGYSLPAEWEPHRATWLAWPHNEADWPGKFEPVRWVFAEMAYQLQEAEKIGLIVGSAPMRREAEQTLQAAGVSLARVELFEAPTNRSWTRDFLPTFLVKDGVEGHAKRTELGAVKWRFNGWARYDNHELDDAAGARVAERAPRVWQPRVAPRPASTSEAPRIVLEGGAIDADGQGTLLTTEACLLGSERPRNPALDREGNERFLSEYLGIDKVLWLPGGIEGDDTSGHVDDVARFVAPGRIVLAEESDSKDPNYAFLHAAREYLEGEVDARGRKLEVIGLPMPAPRCYDGYRLPMTYANFYIANGCVLVPTFNDPADRVALGILGELFPDRRVIGIHCLDLVLGLGAIHCSTHEEPAV
jgi:agmatine deiminase